jgi:hypothetical protein
MDNIVQVLQERASVDRLPIPFSKAELDSEVSAFLNDQPNNLTPELKALLAVLLEADEPTPPEPEPDWLGFRIAILQDPAYQALTGSANSLNVSRLETEIREQDTYLQILPLLWSQLVSSAQNVPVSDDYQRWNSIAEISNIPIRWTEDGELTPL